MKQLETILRIRSLDLVCALPAAEFLARLKSMDGHACRVGLRSCVVVSKVQADRSFVIRLKALTGRSHSDPPFAGKVLEVDDQTTRIVGGYRLPMGQVFLVWLLGSLAVLDFLVRSWKPAAVPWQLFVFVGIALILSPIWLFTVRMLARVGWGWKMDEVDRLLASWGAAGKQP